MGTPLRKLNLREFLEWEGAQPNRNEYYRGEVFAMTGARRVHGRVVANLARYIGEALDGSPCQVFVESIQLQVNEDAVFYPDVLVTCDQQDLTSEMVFRSPSVVIEVLSPSTHAFDRGQKFAMYRRLDSLREYVLIDPDTRRVEGFRRGGADVWTFHDMSEDAELTIPALAFSVPLSKVFSGL